jgi:hypothetical protein
MMCVLLRWVGTQDSLPGHDHTDALPRLTLSIANFGHVSSDRLTSSATGYLADACHCPERGEWSNLPVTFI